MAKREIYADDLTGAEIDDPRFMVAIDMVITPVGSKPHAPIKVTWDLSLNTTEAITNLIEHSDIADFILRMRPLVKLATPDYSVIRKWAKEAHPEITIGEKGRVPADVLALYRREVVTRVSAPDAK
jgi:hypothetical protein